MARTAAQMEIARHEQRRLEAKLGQIRARESYEYFVSETISRNRERNGQVRACVQCVQCVQACVPCARAGMPVCALVRLPVPSVRRRVPPIFPCRACPSVTPHATLADYVLGAAPSDCPVTAHPPPPMFTPTGLSACLVNLQGKRPTTLRIVQGVLFVLALLFLAKVIAQLLGLMVDRHPKY
jgi:hypothetical protein